MGVSGELLDWTKCFLTTRSRRAVVNGQFSKLLPVASGVPQGSILGPLLFILYIDDIRHVVEDSSIIYFADHLSLYLQVSCYADYLKLQNDLMRVHVWSLKWHPKLNPKKCEAVNVSNKRSPITCLLHWIPYNLMVPEGEVSWCNY